MGAHRVQTFLVPRLCSTLALCWLSLKLKHVAWKLTTEFYLIVDIYHFFIVLTRALHYTLKHKNLTLKHLKLAPTCFGLL